MIVSFCELFKYYNKIQTVPPLPVAIQIKVGTLFDLAPLAAFWL